MLRIDCATNKWHLSSFNRQGILSGNLQLSPQLNSELLQQCTAEGSTEHEQGTDHSWTMFLSSAGFRRHVVFILTEFTNPWGDYLKQAVLKIKKREREKPFVHFWSNTFCGLLHSSGGIWLFGWKWGETGSKCQIQTLTVSCIHMHTLKHTMTCTHTHTSTLLLYIPKHIHLCVMCFIYSLQLSWGEQ